MVEYTGKPDSPQGGEAACKAVVFDMLGSIPRSGTVSGRRHLVGCVIHKIKRLGPVEQRSARNPVTIEVVGSNPIRVAWKNVSMSGMNGEACLFVRYAVNLTDHKKMMYNIQMKDCKCNSCNCITCNC